MNKQNNRYFNKSYFYLKTLRTILMTILRMFIFFYELGLENVGLQQYGATAHTNRAASYILKQVYPGHLTSILLFIEFLKSRVYVDKLQVLEALKVNICQEWENMLPEVRVLLKCNKTGRMFINFGNCHLGDIIFYTWWNNVMDVMSPTFFY